MTPWRVLVALAAVALARDARATTPAKSAPRTSSLGWARLPGAERCIDARGLARAVERRLGRSVFVPPASADLGIEAHVEVAAPPATYRAVVHLLDGDGAVVGTREIEGHDPGCADLAGSVELALALMIDPEATWAAPEPAPAASSPSTTATVAPIVTPTRSAPRDEGPSTPPPADDGTSPPTFHATAGPVLSAGYVPGLSSGAQLRARLDPEGLPAVSIGGVLVPPATTGGATFMLAYGSVAVCPWTGSIGVGALAACLGVGSGVLHTDHGDRAHPIVHPAVEVTLSRRLVGPLVASVDLGVGAPLARPTFHFSHVWQPTPVMATAGLGIGMEAP